MNSYAYDEDYLEDAACILGEFADYMVTDLNYSIDQAFQLFASSHVGHEFEAGNPKYIAGMSGVELAHQLMHELTGNWSEYCCYSGNIFRNSTYWTGWIMAKYQWYKNCPFDYPTKQMP